MPVTLLRKETKNMDESLLLDLAADVGYELAVSGAETYRVEDSVRHILCAYGLTPEVAANPGYILVSILDKNNYPLTRMRRIGFHGNNLDAVERVNALCRKLCAQTPPAQTARDMLEEVRQSVPQYGFGWILFAHFLGAAGFGLAFGCSWMDAFYAGLCGVLIGYVGKFTGIMKVNPIFSTFLSSFLMSMAAYGMNNLGLVGNSDTVIIGAAMILVPGLIFTNALRDMIYGDINSGVNKCVQVVLTAIALALGSAAARNTTAALWGLPVTTPAVSHSIWILCFAALCGCAGFCILFNVHGPGCILCAMGGCAAFGLYNVWISMGYSVVSAIFLGTTLSAIYSEIMARVRKYPTICYLVISILPLIPGASLYHTMRYAVDASMERFVYQGLFTAELAGIMAASIILVSSVVRMYTDWKRMKIQGKGIR